ncbi:MAG TPA: DUF1684 domain-containing protein [Acidimicrobiia bacterium]|nr:DUF1684 domain-containing protein [Acidimicrobiia bacterium]
METAELIEFRRQKDEFFRTGQNTPLGPGDHSDFEGLAYFDPNPDLVFTTSVEPGDGSEVRVQTSDDREKVYSNFGTVSFEIAGQPVELTVYETVHGLFLPFRDATSGHSTYGAGRYLDLEPNEDGTLTIDFNLAYNPSCVYSDGWSCPIPPPGNWMQVPVEAGEKNFPV